MYSTCLFCHGELGTNEVIEHFPIGRRLAFDASKGRLWVVCRKCERWNLTPIEERWEAIEECERLFTSTRLRVSTDNIGLAKLREGLELVRIGSALRPEMAAWRYGDQFGRRRRKHFLWSAAGIATVGGLLILGPATGIVAGGGWGSWQLLNGLNDFYQKKRVRLRLMVPGQDRPLVMRKKHLEHTALVADRDAGWLLQLSHDPSSGFGWGTEHSMLEIRGAAALRVAGQVLPKINAKGATQRDVQSAVRLLEQQPDPVRLFESQARQLRASTRSRATKVAAIAKFPLEARLALEMAAHEEQERRALEGELALLEAAWREAEEVAHIADDMFLPESTTARLEQLKQEG
jgi:hypothetical protein